MNIKRGKILLGKPANLAILKLDNTVKILYVKREKQFI